jgi:hypothetical protein
VLPRSQCWELLVGPSAFDLPRSSLRAAYHGRGSANGSVCSTSSTWRYSERGGKGTRNCDPSFPHSASRSASDGDEQTPAQIVRAAFGQIPERRRSISCFLLLSVISVRDAGQGVLSTAEHDNQTSDLASQVSLQKSVVILEGHATVRIPLRPEHIGVSQ